MGGTSYSHSDRRMRSASLGYTTKSIDDNFQQNRKRKAHDSMKSQGIKLREARDSKVNPNTLPIIIALDLTGSMQDIPQRLIRTGLPKLVSLIMQAGVQSPAILFLGVGDHECDREPLQVGQFESGDEELDLWLTRTYLEGGGGGNGGESYGLAHYFAARHIVTDHFEKRGKKGILITIGDEPSLTSYPSSAMKEIMGNGDIPTFSDASILAEAQKQWEVFHINPRDEDWRGAKQYWKQLLGNRLVNLKDFAEIPDTLAEIVIKINAEQGNNLTIPIGISEENDNIVPLNNESTEEIL